MLFELAILINTLIALWIVRLLAPDTYRRCGHAYRRLARRRWTGVVTAAASALAGSALLSVLFQIPQPMMHDEFSYLLAGDTFARGRLTNPPHRLWECFEAIHVNVQPTYHSMYPPGQGAALALGQVLAGHPIVGVWLSMGAACGAICWMMQAWLPPRWALFGAAVATIRLVFSPYPRPLSTLEPGYWSHSYWGGAVAALGGALLFGAVGRLVKAGRTVTPSQPGAECAVLALGNGFVLAIGCAILANSRPFEGLVAALYGFVVLALAFVLQKRNRVSADDALRTRPLTGPRLPGVANAGNVASATHHIFRGRETWRFLAIAVVLPFVAVLGPTGAFMLYYNDATTGDPLQMPYRLNMAMYSTTPVCLLGELRPVPEYRHDAMRQFYLGWVRAHFVRQQSLAGFVDVGRDKLHDLWTFFCGPLLTFPLAAGLLTVRSLTSRFTLLGCLTAIWALANVTWMEPHYLAPVAGLFYLFTAQGVRFIGVARLLRSWLAPVFAPALLITAAVSTGIMLSDSAHVDRSHYWSLRRAALVERLTAFGGRHLVLASDRDTVLAQDWIYNSADIDGSSVVWARDSRADQTLRLAEYFSDRKIWRVRPAGVEVELVPYSNTASRRSRMNP